MIRAVIDTSILVRAVLKPEGTVGPVLDLLAAGRYRLLYSDDILEEMVDVLSRPRLRRRIPVRSRDLQTVLDLLILRGDAIESSPRLNVCRDPKDDRFLEVAVAGQADVVVSGDHDLLVLHPFRGIPIVGPAEFLDSLSQDR